MVLDLEEIRKNPKFNASEWLTKILSNAEESGAGSDVIDELTAEVEEAIAKSNDNIKNVSQKMISDLPKIARELEITQKEISRLQDDVTRGLVEAHNVQKKTTSSMSTLEKLDSLMTKVLATSQAFQEADKWTNLAKQIEQLLDSGDVNKSYEVILGMEKSLKVLNATQAEERRLILEEMKNRLEALATKHLVLAFDTNNIENAKYFFTVFSNLDRMPQYVKYFQNSEKLKLSQEWRKLVETMSFKDGSVKFYDSIIDHWHSKLSWCKSIFSDNVNPFNVLIDLYAETLATLEPSMLFCFESETKKQPFIDVLILFNQSTDRFTSNLKQLILSQGVATDQVKIESLLKVCFAPFLPQYEKYAKHHEMQIYGKIQSATVAVVASSSNESVLQERIDSSKRLLAEIILHIKEGEEKVKIFNRGYGYLHFGKGLNSGLERFASWNSDIYRYMENTVEASSLMAHGHSQRMALENALAFAEVCGEILRQIMKLDQTLSANCARVFGGTTKESDKNPWDDYWNYYLDGQLRAQILQFVQKKETLLDKAVAQIKKLCRDATQLVFRVTAEPILNQLGKNFAVADSTLKEAIPMEYITQIAEFIMLLPQNLEAFIVSENSSICYAFEQVLNQTEEAGHSPVDFILTSLATSICETYVEKILKLTSLTDGQARQLAQDIDYLGSVLEDLGLKLTSNLLDISKLLKNFSTLNEPQSGSLEKISPRLFAAIRRMKNPTSIVQ